MGGPGTGERFVEGNLFHRALSDLAEPPLGLVEPELLDFAFTELVEARKKLAGDPRAALLVELEGDLEDLIRAHSPILPAESEAHRDGEVNRDRLAIAAGGFVPPLPYGGQGRLVHLRVSMVDDESPRHGTRRVDNGLDDD